MTRFTSILFLDPTVASRADTAAEPECFPDLHLDQVVEAVTSGHSKEILERYFSVPLHDVSAVHYRHEVFRDLEREHVRRPIDEFVTGMRTMRERLNRSTRLWHRLQQQGWFVYAVQAFCDATATLHEALGQIDPASRGLRSFTDYVASYVGGERFQTLVAETTGVQSELQKIRYAVHIEGLKVHVEKHEGQTDYSADIATTFERFASQTAKDYHVRMKDYAEMNHVEEQILECVAKLYPEPFKRLDNFCTKNRGYLDPTLARFDREVRFYLSYLAFMRQFIESGLTFSYPQITTDPGTISADDAFDLSLATKAVGKRRPVVTNDFHLSGSERIFVVTGPNQGGKTTFARTVGQIAYTGSLGCPVPASRATLTLPDEIYTHFERQETLATLRGKLDNELVRIHDILSRATADSVVVMNESFSSTTVNDSVLIGTEVLHRIIGVGCIAVYVTFLDELASLDPACVSMVAEVAHDDPTQRTFKVIRRPADGLAYAAALADKYGLAHDALLQRIGR